MQNLCTPYKYRLHVGVDVLSVSALKVVSELIIPREENEWGLPEPHWNWNRLVNPESWDSAGRRSLLLFSSLRSMGSLVDKSTTLCWQIFSYPCTYSAPPGWSPLWPQFLSSGNISRGPCPQGSSDFPLLPVLVSQLSYPLCNPFPELSLPVIKTSSSSSFLVDKILK